MGKKNKNNNIWDLTTDEQQKIADEMYELEMEEYNEGIFSLTSESKGKKKNKNSFDKEVERNFKLMNKEKKKKKKDRYEDDEYYDDQNSIPYAEFVKAQPAYEEDPESEEDLNETVDDYCNDEEDDDDIRIVRKIYYDMNTELNRLIVDDAIAPTSFSLDIGKEQVVFGNFNFDTIQNLISYMFDYIISLKHPSAIFKYDEFMSDNWKFNKVKEEDYDINSFKFLEYEDYIYCYALDDESFKEFIDVLDKSEYSEMELLKIVTSLSYACGTMHQAFFIEDEAYVDKLYNSVFNDKEAFHDLFINDPNTVVSDDKVSDEECIEFTSTKELQTYVRKMISTVTDSNLYGEYDSDDIDELLGDEDDEDEEESNNIESAITDEVEDEEEHISDTAEIAKEASDKITNFAKDLFTDEMDPIAMLSEALNSSAVKETKLDIKPEVEEVKETPKPPVKPEKKVEKKEEDSWDDFVIPVIRKNGDN